MSKDIMNLWLQLTGVPQTDITVTANYKHIEYVPGDKLKAGAFSLKDKLLAAFALTSSLALMCLTNDI